MCVEHMEAAVPPTSEMAVSECKHKQNVKGFLSAISYKSKQFLLIYSFADAASLWQNAMQNVPFTLRTSSYACTDIYANS